MNSPTVPTSGPSSSNLPRSVWLAGGAMLVVISVLASALVFRRGSDAPAAPLTNVASSLPNSATSTLPQAPLDAPIAAAAPAPVPVPPPAPQAAPRSVAPAENRVATSSRTTSRPAPAYERSVARCENCGVVESVQAVQRKGSGTGIGAVAGGVLGGVVGSQMGGGSGRTAMSVLGALGGGVAGNEVERRQRAETVYDVRVRMDDGTIRTLTMAQAPAAAGQRVAVEGDSVRVINRRNG